MNRNVVIAGGILVVLVVLGWIWWPRAVPQETAPAPLPGSQDPTPATVTPEATEPAPLPPLGASDPLAMEALRAAGAGTGVLASTLDQDALVTRFVAAVYAVSQGRSPVRQIGFLEPEGQFRTTGGNDDLVVAPGAFARYDGLAVAIGGLDSAVLVERYREMEPLFQEAFAEMGEEGSFRTVLLQALDHLLGAPVPELPIRLQDHVEYYAYADPRLEGASDAQKQLLRLGPDNQRVVQAKLRDLRQRLGAAG